MQTIIILNVPLKNGEASFPFPDAFSDERSRVMICCHSLYLLDPKNTQETINYIVCNGSSYKLPDQSFKENILATFVNRQGVSFHQFNGVIQAYLDLHPDTLKVRVVDKDHLPVRINGEVTLELVGPPY